MPARERVDQFRAQVRNSFADLFDQRKPFGRLALVHVLMLSGDTLVTVSLAGSLFFSISPTEAKSKVLLYLVLTLAPFSVVSPLLGPLIDRSRGARRAMVITSAGARAVLCIFMARDVHSLLLFPEAFAMLVFSKLYLVTRGALVPELGVMVTDTPHAGAEEATPQYATLNARLTLLGTVAGLVISTPGVAILKLINASGVLIFDTVVFTLAVAAAIRLPVPAKGSSRRESPAVRGQEQWSSTQQEDLARLGGIAAPEVLSGLSAMSVIRGLSSFLIFLLAFGLRRLDAPLYWYGLALLGTGFGALIGLSLVSRLRQRFIEQQILILAMWVIALGSALAALKGTLLAEVFLSAVTGFAGALAQPSFDALTQRLVPAASQGRAFARFATRQQLVWVVGALIPVLVSMPLATGDAVMAMVAAGAAVAYISSRRALRHRALPRRHGESAA